MQERVIRRTAFIPEIHQVQLWKIQRHFPTERTNWRIIPRSTVQMVTIVVMWLKTSISVCFFDARDSDIRAKVCEDLTWVTQTIHSRLMTEICCPKSQQDGRNQVISHPIIANCSIIIHIEKAPSPIPRSFIPNYVIHVLQQSTSPRPRRQSLSCIFHPNPSTIFGISRAEPNFDSNTRKNNSPHQRLPSQTVHILLYFAK